MVGGTFSRFSIGTSSRKECSKKKKEAILTTFLFNSPNPLLVTDTIRHEGSKQWIEKKKRKFRTKLANSLKDPLQLKKDKVDFANLSRWYPHLFVNRNDWICSGYIGYFKRRKRLKEIDSDEWMLDTMYSTRALLKDKVKNMFKTALQIKKEKNSDYQPFYLLPSAILTINAGCDGDKGRGKHGIRQWKAIR